MKKALGHISCLIISITAAIAADSCSGAENDSAVPKPEGWPRIELPGRNHSIHTAGPATLMFNSDADVSMQQKADASWWITVTYPQFSNATLYLTLSPVSRRETSAIMDNRRERMELNSGGATTVITELTSAGNWHCELAETRTSLTTPVQLLATDSASVLSGAFYLDLPAGSSPDSIAPIVRTVRDDMLYLLKNL